MFDSKLTLQEINRKFSWKAVKRITIDKEVTDGTIIKEHIKKYGGHFGNIIKINKLKYILIYFDNENDMMNAVYKSGMEYEIGKGFN